MARRLPPLNSLRAFESAARHLSFTKAGAELNVTPAAVGLQVKTLEDSLGVKLFRRLNRALSLTDAGKALNPLLSEGFDRLALAVAQVEQHQESGIVTVSVTPSFAAKWLVPRLDAFRRAYPQFDVRVDATDRRVDFQRDGVDMAVRYGRGHYPELHKDLLFEEKVLPVCSPKLLEDPTPLRRPEDLKHHTLLHCDWRVDQDAAPSWGMWLLAAGIEGIASDRGPRFSMETLAVQAALEGHGVALAPQAIVQDDLAKGRLIQPFDPSLIQDSQFNYYLVCPHDGMDRPRIEAFRNWILGEARKSETRTDGIEETGAVT